MLVPDGIFVYDGETVRAGKFPPSFIAIDEPDQNPDRKTGYLWLEQVTSIKVWDELCYERLTANGGSYSLNDKRIIDPIFVTLLGKVTKLQIS